MYLEDSVSIGQQLEDAFTEAAKDMPEKERVSDFNVNMMEAGFLSRDPGEFARKWEGSGLVRNMRLEMWCCIISIISIVVRLMGQRLLGWRRI
jgi:hypothetical protein